MKGVYYNKAKQKAKYHEEAKDIATRKNDILSILNIALIALSGIGNNIVSIAGYENKVISGFISGILYASLFVSGVQKYYNFQEIIEKHSISINLYTTLYENIEDANIPVAYIRSQYQLLRAMGYSIKEIHDIDTDSEEDLNVTTVDISSDRDLALEFEMKKGRDKS